MLKMLTWNVRGIGGADKRVELRKMVKENNVGMVFIQETKAVLNSDKEVSKIRPNAQFGWYAIPAGGVNGNAGGYSNYVG